MDELRPARNDIYKNQVNRLRRRFATVVRQAGLRRAATQIAREIKIAPDTLGSFMQNRRMTNPLTFFAIRDWVIEQEKSLGITHDDHAE